MKILANENIPRQLIQALRKRKHDVLWARTDMSGASDQAIAARAESEERVLLTQDKDFGEAVFHRGLSGSSGIVLIRMAFSDLETVTSRIVVALESRPGWTGTFAVIEEGRVRIRLLRIEEK